MATNERGRRSTKSRPKASVTIHDIARRAGVSIATASRALGSTSRRVRADLQKKVLKAVEELDYRPNIVARSLQSKRTHTLGLIVPDGASLAYAEIARGAEDVCRRNHYRLFICNTDFDPGITVDSIRDLRQRQVDGVIIAVAKPPEESYLGSLHRDGFPMTLIGRYSSPLPAVRIDNVKAAWEQASYLIRLRHRDIAIISGPMEFTNVQDRMKGYSQAFAEHGLPWPKDWVVHGDFRPASALPLAQRLLAAARRPSAIIAVNDQTAVAAIRAAALLGLRVPEDVSVIGFDNIALASYVTPTLTTINNPLHVMGRVAAEMTLHQISGSLRTETEWLTTELVVRESTGPRCAPKGQPLAARKSRRASG